MPDEDNRAPDSTALRVALWRAIHVQVDAPPHVWDDMVGLALAAPDEGWRRRPDMDIRGTSRFRASVVARALRRGTRPAPTEMLALAREAGFREVRHVSAADLTQRYFAGRSDGLRPGSEELLVAMT